MFYLPTLPPAAGTRSPSGETTVRCLLSKGTMSRVLGTRPVSGKETESPQELTAFCNGKLQGFAVPKLCKVMHFYTKRGTS